MQQARLRKDPVAVRRLYGLGKVKTRPSTFPETTERHPQKARKVRPLDHLSQDERRVAAELEHGGRGALFARRVAKSDRPSSRWWWDRDACAYQVWLFDHRQDESPWTPA